MPVLVEGFHIFFPTGNRLYAFTAFYGEQVFKAFLAVRFAGIDQVTVSSEAFGAECADEMIRMPALSESIDAVLKRIIEKR